MTTNPALAQLQFLNGAWDMELSDASFLPDPDTKVRGSVTFECLEHGAALVMRMGDAATPAATWLIGRDDAEPDYCVLYADDRGVSRVYRMRLRDGTWRMWRGNPQVAQRFRSPVHAHHEDNTRSLPETRYALTPRDHDL